MWITTRLCGLGGLVVALVLAASSSPAGEMPNDFAYLRDVDATILQDMRYAGATNFVGHPVPGYGASECVLVREAAEALKGVQAELRDKGMGLKVYDCYRPARAVAAFVDWAKEPDDPNAKTVYYPAIEKRALFPGYIATRSSHSRGATVDLTLVKLDAAAPSEAPTQPTTAPCTAPSELRSADKSLDMGTSFDCFDAKAHTDASGLSEDQRRNRDLLVESMSRHGFKNYANEWWHFTLEREPYPDTIFDFPIVARR
jgi:D-alanyl-D-alanine dipeptidase